MNNDESTEGVFRSPCCSETVVAAREGRARHTKAVCHKEACTRTLYLDVARGKDKERWRLIVYVRRAQRAGIARTAMSNRLDLV
jgi:hypothetical protein